MIDDCQSSIGCRIRSVLISDSSVVSKVHWRWQHPGGVGLPRHSGRQTTAKQSRLRLGLDVALSNAIPTVLAIGPEKRRWVEPPIPTKISSDPSRPLLEGFLLWPISHERCRWPMATTAPSVASNLQWRRQQFRSVLVDDQSHGEQLSDGRRWIPQLFHHCRLIDIHFLFRKPYKL